MKSVAARRAEPDFPPVPVMVGFWLFCVATAFVVLALTPLTYQLDDIKIVGVYAGGGLALVYWALLWANGLVAAPPRIVWTSYVLYLLVCLLSTLLTYDFARWIGWQSLMMYTALLGFVLLGSSVIQTRKMVEWVLKFWVVICLITTLFGLFHYSGQLERVYNILYSSGPPTSESPFHDLLYTFKQSRSMLSTILNVQFFGNFLLMLIPVAGACAVVAHANLQQRLGEAALRERAKFAVLWLALSGLCVALALACLFTTYSKSSIFSIPIILGLFLGGVYYVTGFRRIPWLWVIAACGALMAATLLYFVWGDLRSQLKNLDDSLGPRRVIFAGALAIFREHPVFGGGPGSFRLLFPEFRSPDYHMVRISNLTLYAHNWVLDLLAETGLLGTAAYLAFLGSVFWLGFQAIRRSGDTVTRIAVVGALAGIVSILTGALTTPMTRWPVGAGSLHAMLGTALGLALFASGHQSLKVSPAARMPSYAGLRWLTVAATLVFLVVASSWSFRAFRAAIHHNEGWKRSLYGTPSAPADDSVVVALLRESERHLKRSLELDPTRVTTYYRLAHVYNRLNALDKARETYAELSRYAPDYAEIHYNLGVIHYNLMVEAMAERDEGNGLDVRERILANGRASVDAFERAAELNNKITVVYFHGMASMNLGRELGTETEEGRAAYRRAGEIFARAGELPVSRVLQEEGQVQIEERQRSDAIRLAPLCFARAGEPLLAARASERHLRQNPTSISALSDAVQAYLDAGAHSEALRLVEESLERNPLNPTPLMLRLNILSESGQDARLLEEAHYLLELDESLRSKGSRLLSESARSRVLQIVSE